MESGPLREVVSNRQLNAKGEPYGIDGAKDEIDFRAEILELRYKKRGVEDYKIKRSNYSLPKSVLYTLASNGLVSAIDADTGVHHWDRVIDSGSRVVGLGASTVGSADNVLARCIAGGIRYSHLCSVGQRPFADIQHRG